jgi:putative FmdB family regulatory protein
MPTYRYECRSCGKIHEVFQSISEPRLRKCPDCGGRLERLIGGGAGVLLKGGGFYSTENRSDSYRQAAKGESDSKPAAKESTDKSAPAEAKEGTAKSGEPPAKDKVEKKEKSEKKAKKGDGKAKQ